MIKETMFMDAMDLIRANEGLKLRAYRCPAGVWTIGWGHTRGVEPGDEISVAEADRLLAEDVAEVERQMLDVLDHAELTRNQSAALVSFIFNVGIGAFSRSTLCRRIKADPSDPRIRGEFMRWTRGGGNVLPGLVSRRMQEVALYFAP